MRMHKLAFPVLTLQELSAKSVAIMPKEGGYVKSVYQWIDIIFKVVIIILRHGLM